MRLNEAGAYLRPLATGHGSGWNAAPHYDIQLGGIDGFVPVRMPMSDLETNYGYRDCWRTLGLGLMFSHGGALNSRFQAGRHEKTLLAVMLWKSRMVSHEPTDTQAEVRLMLLDARPSRCGSAKQLRWGETYSIDVMDGRWRFVTFRADLCEHVDAGADDLAPDYIPDAPESPPALWEHAGDPVLYETLADMSALLL
jgi:hypothetical protein